MGLQRKLVILATSAVVAAPALVATGGPASAAPAPKPEFAKLFIERDPNNPNWYFVAVSGHFNTTKAHCSVSMRLKGDDPLFNDDLNVSGSATAIYGDFSIPQYTTSVALNEDPEGEDEVFAQVESKCAGWGPTSTPNVYGYF